MAALSIGEAGGGGSTGKPSAAPERPKSPLEQALHASSEQAKRRDKGSAAAAPERKLKEAKPLSAQVTPNKSATDITKAEANPTKAPSASGLSAEDPNAAAA